MTSNDSLRPVRVLVVDDDELDRLTVRRCLQQVGIDARVEEAGHAAEALERLRPGAFDCVLLDCYLPGSDALALLRDLQNRAADVPIVIFTGRGDEEIAVQFMKAGAADYLPKASLTPERLATSFRYAVEKARSPRRAEASSRPCVSARPSSGRLPIRSRR